MPPSRVICRRQRTPGAVTGRPHRGMCGIIKNDLRISHAFDIISMGSCKVNPFFPQTHVFFTVFCPFRQRQRALPSAGGAKGLCPLESRASSASAKGARPFGIPSPPAGGTGALGSRKPLPPVDQPAIRTAGWSAYAIRCGKPSQVPEF